MNKRKLGDYAESRQYTFDGSQGVVTLFEISRDVWSAFQEAESKDERYRGIRLMDLPVAELEELHHGFSDASKYPISLVTSLIGALEAARPSHPIRVYGQEAQMVSYSNEEGRWYVSFTHRPEKWRENDDSEEKPHYSKEFIDGTIHSLGYLRYLQSAFHGKHHPQSLRDQIEEAIRVAVIYKDAIRAVVGMHR